MIVTRNREKEVPRGSMEVLEEEAATRDMEDTVLNTTEEDKEDMGMDKIVEEITR